MLPPRRSAVGFALLCGLLVGYAYGWATSAIPSPDDPDVFWVANLGAPFLVLPFFAGSWSGRRWDLGPGLMAATGGLTSTGMVAGFYGLHRVGRDPNADPGHVETLAGAYTRWLSTFVLGRPGGIPWLTIGLVSGCLAGLLALLWIRGSRVAGLLAVSPLVLEPLARTALGARGLPLVSGYPRSSGNLAIWALEAVVGVVAVVLVWRGADGEATVVSRARRVSL